MYAERMLNGAPSPILGVVFVWFQPFFFWYDVVPIVNLPVSILQPTINFSTSERKELNFLLSERVEAEKNWKTHNQIKQILITQLGAKGGKEGLTFGAKISHVSRRRCELP